MWSGAGDRARLSSNVVALGVVSLCMGMSSSMIHALVPVFLVKVLGAGPLFIGLIEGVAESTSCFMKILSGGLSDWLGRRKPLIILGYGLSALIKPLFAVAAVPGDILLARTIDRIGKGVRDSPRDALLADVTPEQIRGSGFGLRVALYTIGAVIGPLSALALGSRLDQVHHTMIAAMATAEAKFAASLSYRVAMRRQSLSRQNIRSMRLRGL